MAAGVNKLHLPLVAWPTHPHYHVAGAEQSHSLNVTEGGSTTTKWNFIQSQTLTLHPTTPEAKAWGPVLHTQSSRPWSSAG